MLKNVEKQVIILVALIMIGVLIGSSIRRIALIAVLVHVKLF